MVMYHYTSRQFAQDINCSLIMRPGPSGIIYLTPETYDSGTGAACALGIIGKPVEFRCEVNTQQRLDGPAIVRPIRDANGNLIREGGGIEYWTTQEITVTDPPEWTVLNSP